MDLVQYVSSHVSATVAKSFVGCTADEIEEIQHHQGVSCLPECYVRSLSYMGKQGVGYVLDGAAEYADLLAAKREFMHDLANYFDQEVELPEDIFVPLIHHGGFVYFFRTKNCSADVPVYAHFEHGCFRRVANSLPEFILKRLQRDASTEPVDKAETLFFYDPDVDAFLGVPASVEYPILWEEISGMIRARYGSVLRGCATDEIEAIQRAQGVRFLPPIYRKLLALSGKRGLDRVFRGRATYDQLLQLKDRAQIVFFAKKVVVPDDIFVFHMRPQKPEFLFFRTHYQEHSPAIYRYMGGECCYHAAASIEQFLLMEISPCIAGQRKWNGKCVHYDRDAGEFV